MAAWFEKKNRIFVKVDARANNNKEYRITLSDDGRSFVAEYGRMRDDGTLSQRRVYDIWEYDKVCSTRLSHGYREISCDDSASAKSVSDETLFAGIPDGHVERLMRRLMGFSKRHIERTYKVDVTRVNANTLAEVANHISAMQGTADIEEFNYHLERIFELIPRDMRNVAEHLAVRISDFAEIISREQANLDIVKTRQTVVEQSTPEDGRNVLERLGIHVEYASVDEFREVRRMLDGGLHEKIKGVYKVTCDKTEAAYADFKGQSKSKKTKLLWHGSRNENWASILENGLLLRPNATVTGKMFGSGIYFAPSARKSWGYTSARNSYWAHGNSDTAYMALFECKYGKPATVDDAMGFAYDFGKDDFVRRFPGKDCLHARAGKALRNDEIIFYDQSQMTIRYIVEFEG